MLEINRNKPAKKAVEQLSPSRQKEIVRYISPLKTKEFIEKISPKPWIFSPVRIGLLEGME